MNWVSYWQTRSAPSGVMLVVRMSSRYAPAAGGVKSMRQYVQKSALLPGVSSTVHVAPWSKENSTFLMGSSHASAKPSRCTVLASSPESTTPVG